MTIEGGHLCIFDQMKQLLARVQRTRNRLYKLVLNLAAPACLIAHLDNVSWLWHARYGHLHFRVLCNLSRKKMVNGMPVLDHVDEYYDGCALGKQHWTAFP
jgi:hypothetical protein